jgi:DNA (cytosine-5)-methyltransferase 1
MTQRPPNVKFRTAKLRCVDLFAGAGGFSLAARAAGFAVIAAVEKSASACETYRQNLIPSHSRTKLYESDILELPPSELRESHFEKIACDVVLGGPPCQGFSTHRINSAGVDDPRNALVLRYFEFVAELRPKVFLLENVPGILWDRHKKFIDSFYSQAAAAGYDVRPPVVLDARDYGVPQRRRRVFILGVSNDFSFEGEWPPPPTHGSPNAIGEEGSLLPWVPAAKVFAKKIRKADENNAHMNHSKSIIDVFKSTPVNGGSRHESGRVLPCHEGHTGHRDVYGRIDPSLPGPTMTTACINPSKGRFVHPTEHHGITVRHAARFQTFPDDFVFHGGLMAAGEQIGNAVPVKLGEVLLRAIAQGIRKGADAKKANLRKAGKND